jgi:hypothetical protein
MFEDALKEVAGSFDRRFLMYVFLPCLLFCGLLLAVWFAAAGGLLVAVARWRAQDGFYQTAQVGSFLVGVYLFAIILNGKVFTILRLYEGYWDYPVGRALKKRGQAWHQQVLRKLNAAAQGAEPRRYDEIYNGYPPPRRKLLDEVMPTSLGNILRNAELYPTERYQIDALVLWPRLYGLLPDNLAQALDLSRGNMEHMLLLSALGAAFALMVGVFLLIVKGPWWLFLLSFGGGTLVAWAAYRAALGSAQLYGAQIKVAFDLYRNDLLKQLRKPLPATQVAEKQTWLEVCQFLYRDYPKNSAGWTYKDTATTAGNAHDRREPKDTGKSE